MLILNCSHAFADFIEPKRANTSPPWVEQPPVKDWADDINHLRNSDGAIPLLQQWQIHVIKLKRKPCVLALEKNTRFVMVFTDLKAGDPQGFVQQLIERLVNLQFIATQELQVLAQQMFRTTLENYTAQHREFHFYLRSDRSMQTHLNEIARLFADLVSQAGYLPQGSEQCAKFDYLANKTLRSTRSHPDYFVPEEEMLCEWLSLYGGLKVDAIDHVRARFKQIKQQAWELHLSGIHPDNER